MSMETIDQENKSETSNRVILEINGVRESFNSREEAAEYLKNLREEQA